VENELGHSKFGPLRGPRWWSTNSVEQKRTNLKSCQILSSESQGQILALTVLYVPYSFDSDCPLSTRHAGLEGGAFLGKKSACSKTSPNFRENHVHKSRIFVPGIIYEAKGLPEALHRTAVEREGNTLKGYEDFCLKAKARMWP